MVDTYSNAASNPIFIQCESHDIFNKCNLSFDADRADIIFYGLRIPRSVEIEFKKKKEVWLRDKEGWSCLTENNEFPLFLNCLPSDILAVSYDTGCFGVYWTERGEVKDVEKISLSLARWAECKD